MNTNKVEAARAELLAHVPNNVALAKAGFPGVKVLKSDHVRAMRAMRDTCAACGDTLGESRQLAHIAGEAVTRTGYGVVGWNTYVAHPECNDLDREHYNGDAFRIAASLARPDLVFRTIPGRGEAIAWERENNGAAALKARRLAARRPA